LKRLFCRTVSVVFQDFIKPAALIIAVFVRMYAQPALFFMPMGWLLTWENVSFVLIVSERARPGQSLLNGKKNSPQTSERILWYVVMKSVDWRTQ
jgi:hypothetical protein